MNIAELRRLEAEATPGPWFYGISYEPEKGPVPLDYQSPGYYRNAGVLSESGKTVAGCDEYYVFDNPSDAALIVAMRNALPELLKALEWQPIETAPRVLGNRILAYCPDKGIRETFFASSKGTPSESKTDGWWQWHEPANNWVQSWRPTHWMPLPLPPHGGVDAG